MEQSRSDTAVPVARLGTGGRADATTTLPGHPGPGRWWSVSTWPRRRRVVIGLVALSVLATVVVVQFWRGAGPEDVVRDFLTAIQRRDVDKALTIAGVERPTGEQGRFLDAEALSREWGIVAVTKTGEFERDGQRSAQVSVTIAGHDEAREGGFDLSKRRGDDHWHIDRPLVSVRFPPTPLWYLDVNGVTGPGFAGNYLMLPGFYRFFGTASDLAVIKPMTGLLLPVWNVAEGGAFRPVSVSLSEKGKQAVIEAVNNHIDACAVRTELTPRSCPFGVSSGAYVRTQDGSDFTDLASPRWEVLRHPVLAFWDRGNAFQVSFTAPGMVKLTASGRRVGADDDARVRITTYCRIGAARSNAWYTAGLSTPGKLTIRQPDDTLGTC